jgi:serine/threonine protein kinase
MHSLQIAHRDIKPSNIVMSYVKKDGKPWYKICDFGISSEISLDQTVTVRNLMTRSYAALE